MQPVGFWQRVGQRGPDWFHQLEADVVQQTENTCTRNAERFGEYGVGKLIRNALFHRQFCAGTQPETAQTIGDETRGIAAVNHDLAQLLLSSGIQRLQGSCAGFRPRRFRPGASRVAG